MTFFKKKPVAWTVLIVCIVLALFIGINKEVDTPTPGPVDTTLDSSLFVHYVDDAGHLLSGSTEKKVAQANARWDLYYNTHAAVVTTDDDVDIEDYAFERFDAMGLGNGDVILVLAENGDWYFAYGYEIEDALTNSHSDDIADAVQSNPDNDKAVAEFLEEVDEFFSDRLPHRDLVGSEPTSSGGSSILLWIVAIIVVILLISVITSDLRTRRRYIRPRTTRTSRPVVVAPPRRSRPSGGFGSSRTTRSRSGGFGGSRSSSRSGFGGNRSRGGFGGSRGGSRGGRGGRR